MDAVEAKAVIARLAGLPSWGVKRGHSSFVTFEFGQPRLEIGKVHQSKSKDFGPYRARSAYVSGE
jgi:hypothetical protein